MLLSTRYMVKRNRPRPNLKYSKSMVRYQMGSWVIIICTKTHPHRVIRAASRKLAIYIYIYI